MATIGSGYNSKIGVRGAGEYYNTQTGQGFADPTALSSFVNQNFSGANTNSGNVFSTIAGGYTAPSSTTNLGSINSSGSFVTPTVNNSSSPLTVGVSNGQLTAPGSSPAPASNIGLNLGITNTGAAANFSPDPTQAGNANYYFNKPTPISNPVSMPYSGLTSDYKVTSPQDLAKLQGLSSADFSQVQTIQPGQTPTKQFYLIAGSPQVYKNANFTGPTPVGGSNSGAVNGPAAPSTNTSSTNPTSGTTNVYGDASVSPDINNSSNTLTGTPTTENDIQSLLLQNLNQQDALIQNVTSALNDPAVAKAQSDALNAQQEVSNNDVSLQGGLTDIMHKPIPLEFQQGQAAALTRDNAFTRSSLVNQANYYQNVLTSANTTRTQKLQAAQFMYDANRNKLSDTINLFKSTAPENIGTQYNPTTGDLYTITRNPLTGETTTTKAANIGAQKSYTSTSIETDPNTGQLMFVGVTGSGEINVLPISGNGNAAAGSNPSFGSTVNPATGQPYRTDRNNNPIAAAVTTNGTNQFTKALDNAGISWTYGDAFPNNPNMSTIKVTGNPIEAARAILSNTNALQGWYANSTGAQVMKQYGIKNNTDFQNASPQTQNAVIAGIYKNEGGSGSLIGANTNPTANLPAALTGGNTLKYTSDGVPFLDKSLLTAAQVTMAKNLAPNIPILESADVSKVQDIDNTKQNLQDFQNFVTNNFGSGFTGKLGNILKGTVGSTFGSTFDTQIQSYRTVAINGIQSLAGGSGSGLRITASEIALATDNLPNKYDTQQQAQVKLNVLNGLLDKWKNTLLPNAAGTTNSNVSSYLAQLGL